MSIVAEDSGYIRVLNKQGKISQHELDEANKILDKYRFELDNKLQTQSHKSSEKAILNIDA